MLCIANLNSSRFFFFCIHMHTFYTFFFLHHGAGFGLVERSIWTFFMLRWKKAKKKRERMWIIMGEGGELGSHLVSWWYVCCLLVMNDLFFFVIISIIYSSFYSCIVLCCIVWYVKMKPPLYVRVWRACACVRVRVRVFFACAFCMLLGFCASAFLCVRASCVHVCAHTWVALILGMVGDD